MWNKELCPYNVCQRIVKHYYVVFEYVSNSQEIRELRFCRLFCVTLKISLICCRSACYIITVAM